METLWKNVNVSWRSDRANRNLFLFLNTVIFALLGLLIWFFVQFFALRSIVWAFGFMGYPGFFVGFIGGILFLWKKI